MKIFVTLKKVIDPEAKIKVKNGVLVKDNYKYLINPFDEIAVEEAILIKEKYPDTQTVLVSISDEISTIQIKHALAMGIDKAILIKVKNMNIDSLNISKILSNIFKEEKPDLILMGKQAVDDDFSTVPQMTATLLNYSYATFASKIEIFDNYIKVNREIDNGIEVIKIKTPSVVSVDLRLNKPRHPTFLNISKAKNKEIKIIELNDDFENKVELIKLNKPESKRNCVFLKTVDGLAEIINKNIQK